jgi:hypothetical protein
LDVNLGLWAKVLEGNLVFTTEKDCLNVLNFGVTEEEPILAEETLGLLSINSDDDISDIILISSLSVCESEAFEANTIAVGDRLAVSTTDVTDTSGEEVEGFIRVIMYESVVALEKSVVLLSLLIDLDLLECILKILGLALVVLEELLLGHEDSLIEAGRVVVYNFHASELVLLNFSTRKSGFSNHRACHCD